MKKSKIFKDFKSKFPTLLLLAFASCETAIEIKNKKGAAAYFNNAYNFGCVAVNLPKLAAESAEYQKLSEIEENRKNLLICIEEKFPHEEKGLLLIVLEHSLHLIFMNIGGGKALESALLEYQSENEEKF